MRMKRGTDHNWQIRRYRGDIALYAHCKCGYDYSCASDVRNEDGTWGPQKEVTKLYPYCPWCGARKKTYDTEVTRIPRYPWYLGNGFEEENEDDE